MLLHHESSTLLAHGGTSPPSRVPLTNRIAVMLMPGHSDRATVELCAPGSPTEPKFSLVLDMDLTLLQVVTSVDFAWTTDNAKDLQMVSHLSEPSPDVLLLITGPVLVRPCLSSAAS